MPEPSHNRTHRRIARFTPVISSHPKSSSNRAAPTLIETRNQLLIKEENDAAGQRPNEMSR